MTGSQDSGDAYVVAVLEALIADPDAFDTRLSPRTALYRVFLKVWNSLAVNHQKDVALSDISQTDRRLSLITPRPRQAFLLVAVEGFGTTEAAKVLDATEADVRLVDQAGAEIAEQIVADVLIIEDEPLIAMDLRSLVQEIGHRVKAVARTHAEAVEAVKRERPDSCSPTSSSPTAARVWRRSTKSWPPSTCRSSSSRPIRSGCSPETSPSRCSS